MLLTLLLLKISCYYVFFIFTRRRHITFVSLFRFTLMPYIHAATLTTCYFVAEFTLFTRLRHTPTLLRLHMLLLLRYMLFAA